MAFEVLITYKYDQTYLRSFRFYLNLMSPHSCMCLLFVFYDMLTEVVTALKR